MVISVSFYPEDYGYDPEVTEPYEEMIAQQLREYMYQIMDSLVPETIDEILKGGI